MKPYLKPKRCLAAAALILLAACSEDIIGTDEAPQPQDTVITQEPDVDLNDTDDNIANTSFDRTVKVIFSDTEGATVQDADGLTVTVSGNDVTINNPGSSSIYELSGSTADGFFKLYSAKKQAIRLNGVSIKNPNGAAINNQSKKRTFVVVNGDNSLADGATYTDTPSIEDEKAAYFSEGQLIFSGTGSEYKGTAGIKEMLDDMHKRKIDMADEIYVINVGGYIGESTRSEFEYAKKNGRGVRYLEEESA